MTAKSFYRGHKIEAIDIIWVYSDTKQRVELNPDRCCGYCKLKNTIDGHDGCLGELKGLMNACCGHGEIKEAYVQFLDGYSVHGKNAKIIIDVLKDLN